MKKAILFLFFGLSYSLSAQVAIGKTVTSNSSVSLEFYDQADNTKAIVLPWVTNTTTMTNVALGTMVYDLQDKKVKYFKNNTWLDWSVDTTGVANSTIQNSVSETTNAKVIISENPNNDTTNGIMVLGDSNKAMVLPKVANPHLTIYNPEPGTIVYDTYSKQLAVYNGSVWSFWKN